MLGPTLLESVLNQKSSSLALLSAGILGEHTTPRQTIHPFSEMGLRALLLLSVSQVLGLQAKARIRSLALHFL